MSGKRKFLLTKAKAGRSTAQSMFILTKYLFEFASVNADSVGLRERKTHTGKCQKVSGRTASLCSHHRCAVPNKPCIEVEKALGSDVNRRDRVSYGTRALCCSAQTRAPSRAKEDPRVSQVRTAEEHKLIRRCTGKPHERCPNKPHTSFTSLCSRAGTTLCPWTEL